LISQERAREARKKLYLRIVELQDQEKVLLDCEVNDDNMIGVFKSGMYKLVDGHIYYDNNVIKLRYDLMKHYGANG
jgi:hypothetical protein